MRYRLTYSDPLHTGKHPFQIYLLFLSMVSGLPLIIWRPAGAVSMEDQMPDWMVLVWGCFLFFGAIIALVGVYWRGSRINALTIERIGLELLSPAALVYALGVLMYRGMGAFVSVCILFGFGLACLIRARDIRAIFRQAIRQVERED